jgi:hypothetical protein
VEAKILERKIRRAGLLMMADPNQIIITLYDLHPHGNSKSNPIAASKHLIPQNPWSS